MTSATDTSESSGATTETSTASSTQSTTTAPGSTTQDTPTTDGVTTEDGPTTGTVTASTGTTGTGTTDSGTDSETTNTGTESGTTSTGTESGTDTETTNTGTDTDTTNTGTDTDTTSSGTDTDTTSSGTDTGGDCTPGAVQDCYSGPPETQGVGQCVAGTQECGQGGTWGPCVGEVLPGLETCEAEGDEDCDGVDPCQGDLGLSWSRAFGSPDFDEGVRVGFDGAGNVVVAGRATSAIDFGGGPLPPGGNLDVFLAKFSPTGQHLWSKRFGDGAPQGESSLALAVTAAGDIVLAGEFKGKIDLGGGTFTSQSNGDVFLARFAGDGAHVWSHAYVAGSYARPEDVAVDSAGDIILGGYFLISLNLGGGALNSAGQVDAFVGKFTGAGAHVWSQRFGDAQGQYINAVDTDATNNIYMTGGFQGTINPGNGQLVSAGAADIFLFKFNPAGTATWSKRFGNTSEQVGRGLKVDAQGRVTLMAEVGGTTDFGGGGIMVSGTSGALAQFDGAGAHKWSRALCMAGSALPRGLGVDGLGNVLVTGVFTNYCTIGGAPLPTDGSGDIFVARLSPGGEHVWSQRFGDFQNQEGRAIAGSAAGAVAVTGLFQGGVNFGDGPKIAQGSSDAFLAVFAP